MALFVVTYRYEPHRADERETNKPAHREWLSARVDAGEIRTVGPFADGSGALLVVSAPDADAAHELVAADPHCQRSLVSEVTVRQWVPVFGALA